MSEHAHLLHELTARLLGPADPEVGCEECFQRLDEFVDLEFIGGDPAGTIPGMRAHLQGCPACREDYESLRALVTSQRPGRTHEHDR